MNYSEVQKYLACHFDLWELLIIATNRLLPKRKPEVSKDASGLPIIIKMLLSARAMFHVHLNSIWQIDRRNVNVRELFLIILPLAE